jgi:hypothetical protein
LASVQLLQKLEKNTIREKIEFEVVRVVAWNWVLDRSSDVITLELHASVEKTYGVKIWWCFCKRNIKKGDSLNSTCTSNSIYYERTISGKRVSVCRSTKMYLYVDGIEPTKRLTEFNMLQRWGMTKMNLMWRWTSTMSKEAYKEFEYAQQLGANSFQQF